MASIGRSDLDLNRADIAVAGGAAERACYRVESKPRREPGTIRARGQIAQGVAGVLIGKYIHRHGEAECCILGRRLGYDGVRDSGRVISVNYRQIEGIGNAGVAAIRRSDPDLNRADIAVGRHPAQGTSGRIERQPGRQCRAIIKCRGERKNVPRINIGESIGRDLKSEQRVFIRSLVIYWIGNDRRIIDRRTSNVTFQGCGVPCRSIRELDALDHV